MIKHTCGIYLITNNINNLKYVGQSIDIESRWSQHKNAINNLKETTDLYKAMRQYGIENFSFSILEECEKEKLNEREIYWIKYYNSFNNGYNMTHGGQGKNSWKFDPNEIKKLWDKGYSSKEIQKMLNCSQSLISSRLIGYNNYTKELAFARSVKNEIGEIYQYSLLGEYIQSFPSPTIAAKQINNSRNDTIIACLNGKIQSAYGFQWSKEKIDKLSPVAAPHGKLVRCIETNEIFTSTREAAKEYNLHSHTNIVECISGKKKSAGKHKITGEKLHWEYI